MSGHWLTVVLALATGLWPESTAAQLPPADALAADHLQLITPNGYLPQVPLLVRVELRTAGDERDVFCWDAEAMLQVEPTEVQLSTNRLRLRNGIGSVLLTLAGTVECRLKATVGSLQAERSIRNWSSLPRISVAGTLSGSDSVWSGIVQVTNDLVVPARHTLTLQPDTLVLVSGTNSGASTTDIEVRGTLKSNGTREQPITITCAQAGWNWGQIRHLSSTGSAYRYTIVTKAGRTPGEGHTGTGPAVRLTDSQVAWEHCTISDLTAGSATIGKIMTASGSDLILDDCLLTRARMGPEIDGTALYCTNSAFVEMRGPDDCDGLYLHNQKAGQTILITHSLFASGDDDGIDTLGSTITVDNSIIRDWRNLGEDAKGLSIFNGSVTLDRCLVTECYVGVSAKWSGGSPTRVKVRNCTIVSATNAVAAAWKENAPGPNILFQVTNSILTGSQAVRSDFGRTNLLIGYSLISQPWPGISNLVADPRFVQPGTDFRLQSESPCLDQGDPLSPLDPDGTRADLGAYAYDQELGRFGFTDGHLVSGGAFRLLFGGTVRRSYQLEASTNLLGWEPVFEWINANGTGEWIDTQATNYLRRFYRLRLAP